MRRSGQKVVAVFAATSEEASVAVRHVRDGAVELPIHLFCSTKPSAAVAGLCANVIVHGNSIKLLVLAQRALWPYWVALAAAPWTGRHGGWVLKAAAFLLPPFRVVVLNENDDFFAGRPGPIVRHLSRKFAAAARSRFTRMRDVARGLLSYPFALCAQQYSPLSRFAFGRMRGSETLSLAPRRMHDDGIAVFEYQGREWRLPALKELLERTESRWVLFQRIGANGPVDDLLPLFQSERTFAVSRQNGFRGWQKLLFPTAPFQTLQADEVTRVFAPLSDQILVDREKLLALGLPALSAYGSNWYLLFWKAAAAGWRSFSVGGTAKLNELAGHPYFEAQFVHALLLNPLLARLRPCDPLLARGNVSRARSGGKAFRGLPRVMILSPYLPYPLSHGGAVRIYSLCKALADRVDFVLVCFREKGDHVDYAKLHEVFRQIYVVSVDEKHANPSLPAQVSGYESTSMRALIPEVCQELHIDLMQVEYTQMAAYREAAPYVPAILVEHDITFTLFQQLAAREGTPQAEGEYRNWRRFETDRLRAFDTVWTMSEYDRQQAIQAGSAPEKTIAIPNGVDLDRFSGGSESGSGSEILYVGSFRHSPNFLGFEELRTKIMPAVWAVRPDIRLRVVAGPNHEKYWEGSHDLDSRITVHGFVEDIAPLYRQCSLVVAPLPVSAGTNIKVMEALASERAVVTTPVGCVGLDLQDGQDVAIRDPGPAFAGAIRELFDDPIKRRRMARRGRETAEARFSWNAIARAALAAYEQHLARASAADDRSA